jgi:alpha-N-arabinofuranosidase
LIKNLNALIIMKKSISLLLLLSLLTVTEGTAQKENLVSVNQLVVVANNPGPVISKDVYGHFSEHLGACIYGGIWVGTDSKYLWHQK